jgi:hypothetical protein
MGYLYEVCDQISDLVIHIEHICSFFVTFFSATIDGRNVIFGHKLHIGTPYCVWSLWPNIRLQSSIVAEKNATKKWAYMFNVYKNQQSQQTGIWWVQKRFPRYGVPIWSLWPNIIFLSNYWWQKCDIWSQASYRYSILWEAFLDPSDSYFLFAT